MHNQSTTEYENLIGDVVHSLKESVSKASAAGVSKDKIIIDPGFGFGKTVSHNLDLLNNLDILKSKLPYPMLLGTSRKSTIGKVLLSNIYTCMYACSCSKSDPHEFNDHYHFQHFENSTPKTFRRLDHYKSRNFGGLAS